MNNLVNILSNEEWKNKTEEYLISMWRKALIKETATTLIIAAAIIFMPSIVTHLLLGAVVIIVGFMVYIMNKMFNGYLDKSELDSRDLSSMGLGAMAESTPLAKKISNIILECIILISLAYMNYTFLFFAYLAVVIGFGHIMEISKNTLNEYLSDVENPDSIKQFVLSVSYIKNSGKMNNSGFYNLITDPDFKIKVK